MDKNAVTTSDAGSRIRDRVDLFAHVLRETPIIRLDFDQVNLFAKLEFCNVVGSIKDRPACWILRNAVLGGQIDEETLVVESSSGNMATAVAVFCRLLRVRFVAVIDPNISSPNESLLRSLCHRVVKVSQRDDTGGYLKSRLAHVAELCGSGSNVYWTNQYANPAAVEANYAITGAEIASSFSRLDYVFIGVSSGGTIAGVSRRLKERFPSVRIIAVDAEGSVIFGGKPKKRRIPGLGASVVPENIQHAAIDDVVIVSERETVEGCQELLRRHSLFVGGSSGSCYAAVKRYLPNLGGLTKPNVLFLCSDRGTAYADTVYDEWWAAQLDDASELHEEAG